MTSRRAGQDKDVAATKPSAVGGAVPVVTAEKKPRRSSKAGDTMYASFVAAFAGLMYASFNGWIPVMPWESLTSQQAEAWAAWMIEFTWLPFFLSALYVFLVFGGQWYMEDKKPMDLRVPLGLWSLLLAVFSVAGAIRTVVSCFTISRRAHFFALFLLSTLKAATT